MQGFPQGYPHVGKCVDNFVCDGEHGWSYPQGVGSPASDVSVSSLVRSWCVPGHSLGVEWVSTTLFPVPTEMDSFSAVGDVF